MRRFFSIFLLFLFMFSNFHGFAHAKAQKDSVPPSLVPNLTVCEIKTNSVTLSWDPATDDIGVACYYIYKNSYYIASVTSTQYTITGLSPNTTYLFAVKARDAAKNLSAYSSQITVTTTSATTPTIAPTTAPTASPTPVPTPIPSPSPVPTLPPSKSLIGYYASWSAYGSFTPDKINASNLTHINYAFANIGTDLKIALGDPQIDPSNFSKLNGLKTQYPNLKVLISVGGWSWSDKFSDVALSDSSRAVFADSCVEFIKTYGLDGIDLDWEYPVSGGMSTNKYRPEDKQNFTLLLKAIREKLDAQGKADGKQYLLTIAGGAGSTYCNNVELGLIGKYVDFATVMTYDIHGSWDKYTDFNAPLYTPSDLSPQYKWSVDSSVKAWTTGGFPAEKIVLGVPFYGYVYTGVSNANNGLYQTHTSAASATYDTIVSKYLNNSAFTRYYHAQCQVPWLWNGSTFVSYDDEQSVRAKANYIKAKSLAGAAAWHLGSDTNGTLLNALYSGLR